MITITINNSYSKIEGLKTEEFRSIRKLFSYTINPSIAYFSGGYSYPRYLIDKKGAFPTGLLYKVKGFLTNSLKVQFTVQDLRLKPSKRPAIEFLLNSGIRPYSDQEKACSAAINSNRGGIVMPTGTGKSLVIAMIAARLNLKTLVVVPNLEIKKQLHEELTCKFKLDNVRIENIDSRSLKKMTDFDCLIIDECHHVAAKTYQTLNKMAWNNIYYRFFLSATFFRNDANEQLLFEGIAGQIVYKLSNKDAVSRGYICPVEAYYVNLPRVPTDAYAYREVYNELVVNNDFRNGVIAGQLEALKMREKAALCLVKEIAHGNILSELTGIPFANGKYEESREYIEQFKSGSIKQLIGTTGILSEGVDTKPCEYIIIAGLGKAKSSFMQAIGRAVRIYPGKESAKVVLFRDRSHKFTLRHFNEQKKILLDEYGVEVVELS